jgi:site-specific DNA recombinase
MGMKSIPASPAITKHVGIWIRVSTEDQAEGDSPKHHEARARAYAVARGWEVKEVYDLAGVSGKDVMAHSEAKRMMDDVKRGHIQALMFSKLARLARKTDVLLHFAEFFRQHGADLISLQEAIDTSTPAGRLFYTFSAAMAEWEREEITDRIRASVAVRAKLGKPLGPLPFGYQWKEGRIQPQPTEAPVRKLIYELFAEHKRKKTVVAMLNERGLRTRKGPFTDTTIERYIRDPTAKGQYRSNYTKNVGGKQGWVIKPEHEWVITPVEAIVSEALWDECNALLDARKVTRKKPGPRPVHTFAGFVVCECGKAMYVPSNTPKYVCAACRTKIPVADLEGIFHDELKNYLTAPEKIAAYLTSASETATEKEQLLATLKGDVRRVKEETDSLFALHHAGGLTVDQFKTRFQPLEDRRQQLEAEIPKTEGELDFLKTEKLSADHIMAEARDFHARWPGMDTAEKRRIVEGIVKTIVIGTDGITLNLCYSPSFENMAKRQRMLTDSFRGATLSFR